MNRSVYYCIQYNNISNICFIGLTLFSAFYKLIRCIKEVLQPLQLMLLYSFVEQIGYVQLIQRKKINLHAKKHNI